MNVLTYKVSNERSPIHRLMEIESLPDWMVNEFRYDANTRIRLAARQYR